MQPTDVNALCVSGRYLFAGTYNGVFVSTNNGTRWTAGGLPNYAVYALAISGSNLFAGTSGGGVFLSTNNGTSWTPVNDAALTNRFIRALAVSPANGGSGTYLFAGTSGGVYVSTNNGTSWKAASSGMPYDSYGHLPTVYVLAVTRASDGDGRTILYAGTSAGVFLSANNGTTWIAANTGLPCNSDGNILYVYALAMPPDSGRAETAILFAGISGGGVFLSTNDGTSWTEASKGLTSMSVSALAILPASDEAGSAMLFAGTFGGGVFLSTDNGTCWNAANAGLTNTSVLSLTKSPTNDGSGTNLFAGTSSGGVYLSTDNGASWSSARTDVTNTPVWSLAARDANLFAGTGCGVFLSTDNGLSWTAVNEGLTSTSVHALAISPAIDGPGTYLIAGTTSGVFISTNNGTSWSAASTGLTNTIVSSLAANGTNLFAGTSNGVFHSINNGTSWGPASTGLTNSNVLSLAVSSAKGGSGTNVFAGTYGGVFLSTDNGTRWSGAAMPSYAVYSLAVSPVDGGSGTSFFAGTSGSGVFLCTSDAASWSQVNSGMRITDVNALLWSDGYLFAGTSYGGVWRRPLSEMITSTPVSPPNMPAIFSLEQNFPNPFNPTTKIRYQVSGVSNVKLVVYDLLGREVSVLVNEKREAGVHEVRFDGTGLSSGVYFYRLTVGDIAATKRLLLLK